MTEEKVNEEWAAVAAVLRERGWLQGDFEDWVDPNDDDRTVAPVCVLGACGLAWHGDARYFDDAFSLGEQDAVRLGVLADAVRATGYESLADGWGVVVEYNDHHDRMKSEVLALVDGLAGRVLNEFA